VVDERTTEIGYNHTYSTIALSLLIILFYALVDLLVHSFLWRRRTVTSVEEPA